MRNNVRRRDLTLSRWRCAASATALAGICASASCSGLIGGKTIIPETRKFIIEADPILRVAIPFSERPYPFKVEVDKFSVSRVYDKNQIVFRLSPQELREDRFHRWAVRPSEMITDAVEAYLKLSPPLFADIRQQFLDVEPDFSIQGTVKAIERFDSGNVWFARLAMSIQLVSRDNNVIWRDDFVDEEEVYIEDFSHTVLTMSRMLRVRMEQYIHEIDRIFLIRQLQETGQPYEFLLDEEALGDMESEAVLADSANFERRSHPDYDIVPGRLLPE